MDPVLERSLGALWLLGFKGERPADGFLRCLDRYHPRSLILFRDNLPGGKAELPELRRRLEEAADGPLTLHLDEEGGWIQQFGDPSWPSPRAQAMAGIEAVRACHRAMALDLLDLGVEVCFAPLADLDDGAVNPVIGTRSFGADPDGAGAMVAAAVEGLASGGVLPVLKHYPGHGDSLEDSHLTLPAVPKDRSRALIPFRRGVEAGAGALMTAHLRLDGAEDPRPATFRPDLLGRFLAEELGFEGLVITDALEMGGAAVIPWEDRALAALTAGCHLLTLARWEPGAESMLAGLDAAVAAGRIRQRTLDEAAERRERFLANGKAIRAAASRTQAAGTPDLRAIERGALFVPGRAQPPSSQDLADAWDGERLDLEFGPCGHWRQEEFKAALEAYPLRLLDAGDAIESSAYLFIGRRPPAPQRLEELRTLQSQGNAPSLFLCGPWAWSRSFPRRLATAASTPSGLRTFLDVLAEAQGR